jgi:hypothetical protein
MTHNGKRSEDADTSGFRRLATTYQRAKSAVEVGRMLLDPPPEGPADAASSEAPSRGDLDLLRRLDHLAATMEWVTPHAVWPTSPSVLRAMGIDPDRPLDFAFRRTRGLRTGRCGLQRSCG